MGGNGGCGEFDILEGIIGNEYSDMLFTTVYDFKGAGSPGTMKYFQRPSVSRSRLLRCLRRLDCSGAWALDDLDIVFILLGVLLAS